MPPSAPTASTRRRVALAGLPPCLIYRLLVGLRRPPWAAPPRPYGRRLHGTRFISCGEFVRDSQTALLSRSSYSHFIDYQAPPSVPPPNAALPSCRLREARLTPW